MKTTRYRNGDLIPTGLSDTQWQNTTTGAYAIYNDIAQNNNIYGKLYNWYAVADPRELCPTGWHVPSDSEWNQLVKFLDPQADTICLACPQSQIAGGMMKSVGDLQSGTGLWEIPNTGATNSSGFSGLPGGTRYINGSYGEVGDYGYWWSSTPFGTNDAWSRELSYDNGIVNSYYLVKQNGFSVRCIRD
ncbi:MAG: fibrobacter succinogenes major paralogous domain-containing protein [Alphaproteobacteria bacterium]